MGVLKRAVGETSRSVAVANAALARHAERKMKTFNKLPPLRPFETKPLQSHRQQHNVGRLRFTLPIADGKKQYAQHVNSATSSMPSANVHRTVNTEWPTPWNFNGDGDRGICVFCSVKLPRKVAAHSRTLELIWWA